MLRIKKENEDFKQKTWLMKLQIQELELRKRVEVLKTIERKWAETLFTYKQQKEALSSHVEALTQEKEKENVLIDMVLINLKNVSMFNYEEIRRRTSKAKIKKLVEKNKEHQRNLQQLQAQLENVNERKKSLDLVCVKKDWKIMTRCYSIIPS